MTEGLGVLITSAAAGGHHKNDSQKVPKGLLSGALSVPQLYNTLQQ